MNQEKIGKLISECRKKKKLTQRELANILGVTDKSVSKWENGICLPDVSLYKKLCETLEITLNDFFAGEKIEEEKYKEKADENLLNALENSVFTIKDKVEFFENKWQKDHAFELVIVMLTIIFFIIYGFIKNNGIQYLFMIIGFSYGILENNRMMAYIEKNVYGEKTKMKLEDFMESMRHFEEAKELIEKFETKQEAIEYLRKETKISKKECEKAYDVLMKIDFKKWMKEK